MAKNKTTQYVCEQCGNESSKWSGRCNFCGAWNSLSEVKIKFGTKKNTAFLNKDSLKKLSGISETQIDRIATGISEFDRVMGGETSQGIVPGSVTLISGEPGIGKSTLILQVLSKLSSKGLKCLYLSGEESASQIKLRANRLNTDTSNIFLLTETDVMLLDEVISKEKIDVMAIDSIQTVENSNFENSAGSVTQIKESASHVIRLAKDNHIPVFIVGHITKEGSIAGPKILEHLVDVVLYFEGERFHSFRILRVIKNRFGAVFEIGVFEMNDSGLVEIANPSKIFISSGNSEPGSAIAVTIEGTRPILAEVQTLITKTSFGYPKRTASGYDLNRMQILIAVLSRSLRIPLSMLDVYLSVAGGLKVKEPAADLAVCSSIVSAYKKKKIYPKTAFIGEVGLLGELRSVSKTKERINEAEKLGFNCVILPKGTDFTSAKIKIVTASSVAEAIAKAVES